SMFLPYNVYALPNVDTSAVKYSPSPAILYHLLLGVIPKFHYFYHIFHLKVFLIQNFSLYNFHDSFLLPFSVYFFFTLYNFFIYITYYPTYSLSFISSSISFFISY